MGVRHQGSPRESGEMGFITKGLNTLLEVKNLHLWSAQSLLTAIDMEVTTKKLCMKNYKDLEGQGEKALSHLDKYPNDQDAVDEAKRRLNARHRWINLGSIESELNIMKTEWREELRRILSGEGE